MVTPEFHDPSGTLEVNVPFANRLDTLEGKRIGIITNDQWQAYRMMPALKEFLAADFWATKDDGMPRNKIEATANLMKKIGAIKPDKEPVKYETLVDSSVWKDANAMVK